MRNRLKPAAILKILEESSLFMDLDRDGWARIARFSRGIVLEAGDFLFREGDPAENIYVVVKGMVAVEVGLLGRKRRRCATIATARRGDPVGWSAGVGSQSYLYSAYAVEKTTALAIDRGAVRIFFTENPLSGLLVMEKLAELAASRLTRTAGILADMLSTESHDLKAHLAAIQSLQQVVLGGYAGDITEQQKNLLTRAGDRIKGLVSILDDIFEISRVEPCKLQIELAPLEEIARSSIEKIMPRTVGKNIELTAEWDGELPAVTADRGLLQQVLNNLLGNAVKFTQDGGKVALRIMEDNDGRQIVVEVIDNGPGIKREELARIFDDFFRGKDSPMDGAGLGLSNARRIIEAHGGRIWAESPCPGSKNGAKFTFTLPKLTKQPGTGTKEEMSSYEIGN